MSFLVAPSYSTDTSTSDTNSRNAGTTYGSQGGSSSTSATFSPDMQALMKKLLGYSTDSMSDPTKQFAPVRDAALQNINRTYAAVPGQVQAQLSRRGYGSSGAAGDSQYKVALARSGDISDLEGKIAQKGIDQQNFGSQLGAQLLGLTKGTTTTSDSTYNGGSTQIGDSHTDGSVTKQGPSILGGLAGLAGLLLGGPGGAAIGSALGGGLTKLFNGGGGSGGAPAGGGSDYGSSY